MEAKKHFACLFSFGGNFYVACTLLQCATEYVNQRIVSTSPEEVSRGAMPFIEFWGVTGSQKSSLSRELNNKTYHRYSVRNKEREDAACL